MLSSGHCCHRLRCHVTHPYAVYVCAQMLASDVRNGFKANKVLLNYYEQKHDRQAVSCSIQVAVYVLNG